MQLACSATLRVLRPPEGVQLLREGEVVCMSALTAPAGGKGAGLELQVWDGTAPRCCWPVHLVCIAAGVAVLQQWRPAMQVQTSSSQGMLACADLTGSWPELSSAARCNKQHAEHM